MPKINDHARPENTGSNVMIHEPISRLPQQANGGEPNCTGFDDRLLQILTALMRTCMKSMRIMEFPHDNSSEGYHSYHAGSGKED